MRTEARWVVLGGLGSIGKKHVENLRTLGFDPLIVDPAGPTRTYEPASTDRVVIASPSRFHEQQLAAIGPYVQAVLVEKPPALTGIGWSLVKDLCPRLAVAFNWRFHPVVKQFLVNDFDGLEMQSFENATRFPGGPHLFDRKQGGGITLTSGVHSIDLACYIMGAPTEVVDCASDKDALFISLDHSGRFTGIWMIWDWIGGEMRRLMAYNTGLQSVKMAALSTPCNMHLDMMKAFVEYAETGNPGELCTAEQAQWVMDIADHLAS